MPFGADNAVITASEVVRRLAGESHDAGGPHGEPGDGVTESPDLLADRLAALWAPHAREDGIGRVLDRKSVV